MIPGRKVKSFLSITPNGKALGPTHTHIKHKPLGHLLGVQRPVGIKFTILPATANFKNARKIHCRIHTYLWRDSKLTPGTISHSLLT
jgi:hypothetical protein